MLAGCEPPSKHLAGRSDRVRYALPIGAGQLLEHADFMELRAIGPSPEVTVARVRLEDYQRDAVVRAMYRGMRDQRGGVQGCGRSRRALVARRGRETLTITMNLRCGLLSFDSGGRAQFIDASALLATSNSILEREAGARFDPDRGEAGAWVVRSEEPASVGR